MKPPTHVRRIEIVDERKIDFAPDAPFLSLSRLRCVSHYPDGTRSRIYNYDAVTRRGIDAVVLVLTARVEGQECVLLRSSVRPPLLLRERLLLPVADERRFDALWELPAGIVEPGDDGEAGVLARAVLETREETGYELPAAAFELWPGRSFLSPGVIPERLHFAQATIPDVTRRGEAEGDGSAVEERAEIHWLPLVEVLGECEAGAFEDMKTELGLRRLLARRGDLDGTR